MMDQLQGRDRRDGLDEGAVRAFRLQTKRGPSRLSGIGVHGYRHGLLRESGDPPARAYCRKIEQGGWLRLRPRWLVHQRKYHRQR